MGLKSWNATQLITDWIANPSNNYGLMINSDPMKPADTYRTFASSKNSNPANHPYLVVTYTGGGAPCTNPRYKVEAGAMYDYPSIQAAYSGLYPGDVLQIQAGDFSGGLTLDQEKSIALDGGYTCDFSSNSGYTTINGMLTISHGTITLDKVILR
jgi:hypothetical protein